MPSVLSLRAFCLIIEVGTVTAAAGSLGRTQPQVSRLISELEQEVGFSLFFRQRRRLVPTQRGSRLYTDVKRALNGLDDVDRIAEEIRTDSEAVLRILIPPYAAGTILPRALKSFVGRFPERRYSVEIITRNSLGAWVSFHPFDVGMASVPFDLPAIHSEPFATVDTVVAMPAEHPLAGKDVVDIHDLVGVPFIAMNRSTPMQRIVSQIAQSNGVELNVVGETTTSVSACEMVAHGLGVTVVDAIIPLAMNLPGIVFRRWSPGYRSQYGLIFPVAAKPSKAALDFSSILVETTLGLDPDFVRRTRLNRHSPHPDHRSA